MRKIFATLLLCSAGLQCAAAAQGLADAEDFLPFGNFPHIAGTSTEQTDPGSLGHEVKNLGTRVQDTVKTFASYRDTTCFGGPCAFQAFPMMYSKANSGFFGGFRAKLTNISRTDPYLFSLETGIIRSDTQQWITFLAGDFPAISFLPLHPRFKTKGFYSRTTETRWYGAGETYDDVIRGLDQNYRYSLSEIGINNSLIIPLFEFSRQKIGLFTTFNSINHAPKSYAAEGNSKLFIDHPRGYKGGISSHIGMGLLIDSRDRETLTRQGSSLEIAAEYSRPPFGQYDFRRLTLIDRRYFSTGRVTIANRSTLDGIIGYEPFWELSSVGGIDPIMDVSASQILRGFPNGRFHEKFKLINSTELRIELNPVKLFGLLTQFILTPFAADLGRLSEHTAASFTTGTRILFNRNFLVQVSSSYSKDQRSVHLSFGQDF